MESRELVAPVVLLPQQPQQPQEQPLQTQHQHSNDRDRGHLDTLHGHGQRTLCSRELVAPVVLLL